jgi:hypothetical protein
VAGSCEHGNGPSVSIKDERLLLTIWAIITFSRRALFHGVGQLRLCQLYHPKDV